MNIIPFRGLLPNLNIIPDHHHFFESVKTSYTTFRQQQYFLDPEDPAFYVFRIQRFAHMATGLICTTDIQDYLKGKVLKHEKTIRSKEQVQIRLLRERRAAVKPALLVHRHRPEIRDWLQEFTLKHPAKLEVAFQDGDRHTLWQVSRAADREEIRRLYCDQLAAVAIADGHHRFASFASLYRQTAELTTSPFSAVLTAYFPADELQIEAFHRFIELPDRQQRQHFLRALAQVGTLKPLQHPELPLSRHQIGIILPEGCYLFEWAPRLVSAESPQKPILDVDLLHQHVLVPLLEVKNIRTDRRVRYLESIENAARIEQILKDYPPGVCFLLHPIHAKDFLEIANLGLTLGPKATFFQPRLKNGLVVMPLL